jgi:hypothetical protein
MKFLLLSKKCPEINKTQHLVFELSPKFTTYPQDIDRLVTFLESSEGGQRRKNRDTPAVRIPSKIHCSTRVSKAICARPLSETVSRLRPWLYTHQERQRRF